jgi:beta-glucosidase/6-phospho-beta-glucosidase/beta-galactosidase
MVHGTCETVRVSDQPRLLATLEGYAVEGGFDRAHEPSTCFVPTIALGRHEGPGDALGLWRDYEQVIEVAATLGLDGLRITMEWARIEPRRGVVDDAALERYAQVARFAHGLGLRVTVALVDAAWPSWLGQEAWLLPWVVPYTIEHARRVVTHLDDVVDGVVVFTNPDDLVANGYLNEMAPPWRRGASDDAASARIQLDEILRQLLADETVGPKLVSATTTLSLDLTSDEFAGARAAARGCDEIYVRTLVRGRGPSAGPPGLLERHENSWSPSTSAQLLEVLR